MKKILVIRFSSIGDIVLTTPVLRALKEQAREEIELHFVTKEGFAPVVRSNPHVDRIHAIQKDIGEVIGTLKEESFDHVIDLHKNLRSTRLRKALGRPSTTFPKLNWQKWLMVNWKWDRLPRVHIVDRYFKAVERLGVTNDGKGLEHFIPEEEEEVKEDLPGAYLAFAIGGAHATKCLPEEKIIAICDRMELPVVLLGGNEDREKGERIRDNARNSIINGCGAYNINGSATIVRDAIAVLTHDTGMMHIAAAFKKEILSFWGNTIPAFGMYPYMPGNEDKSHVFEVKGLSCRPCSKIGYEKCPKGHFKCMEDIEVDEVAEALQKVIARKEL